MGPKLRECQGALLTDEEVWVQIVPVWVEKIDEKSNTEGMAGGCSLADMFELLICFCSGLR